MPVAHPDMHVKAPRYGPRARALMCRSDTSGCSQGVDGASDLVVIWPRPADLEAYGMSSENSVRDMSINNNNAPFSFVNSVALVTGGYRNRTGSPRISSSRALSSLPSTLRTSQPGHQAGVPARVHWLSRRSAAVSLPNDRCSVSPDPIFLWRKPLRLRPRNRRRLPQTGGVVSS
jgi:hypothetical protein